jgi:hypothetical protein
LVKWSPSIARDCQHLQGILCHLVTSRSRFRLPGSARERTGVPVVVVPQGRDRRSRPAVARTRLARAVLKGVVDRGSEGGPGARGALPAPHERQGRTLHPHAARALGLRRHPTAPQPNGRPHSPPESTSTITADPTAASATRPRQRASPRSRL